MKYLKTYEALKPSQFREYVKEFDKDRYSKIFKEVGDIYEHDKNYYRIYIPLVKEGIKGYISDTHKEVDNFLKENDCELLDYIKGKAKYNNSKNETTIGKILTRLKNDQLNTKFQSDEKRKALTATDNEDLLVVISRHPYDIAGSDTDRNWTNCMTIGTDKSNRLTKLMDEYEKTPTKDLKDKIKNYKENGVNIEYLIHEVKEGSLISYLIKSSDKNINNPLAVLNIKPYNNEEHTGLFTSSNMYGVKRTEFKNIVDSILDKYFNKNISGELTINKNVYNDNERVKKFVFGDKLKIEEKCKILGIKNYTINKDKSIDVNGDVDIKYYNLTKIPLKFGKITGNFLCSDNGLTSLEGAPQSVGGNFDCSYNGLTSLEGSPQSVGGNFDCTRNQLTSLEGVPQSVGGNFDCSYNELTSLEGGPQSVSSFNCELNRLINLKGGPKRVSGNFNCSYNDVLTSLKGAPQSVVGDFSCNRNQLTSLEGAPQSVGGNFSCNNNQLTSLEGAPQSVGGNFDCSCNENDLLLDRPKFIKIKGNYIVSPQKKYK